MGDWGKEPWETDEAADWFHKFWREKDFTVLIEEIETFDACEERYESVRAACYLLQVLGIVYVWPVQYLDKLKPLLKQAISILSNMIDPPDETWAFLDLWGDDPGAVQAVRRQIDELTMRLDELA